MDSGEALREWLRFCRLLGLHLRGSHDPIRRHLSAPRYQGWELRNPRRDQKPDSHKRE